MVRCCYVIGLQSYQSEASIVVKNETERAQRKTLQLTRKQHKMCRIENSGLRLCKNICGFIFVNINHGTYCLLYIEQCFLLPTLKTTRYFKSRVPTISVFLSVFSLFAGGSIAFQIVRNGRTDHVVRVVA